MSTQDSKPLYQINFNQFTFLQSATSLSNSPPDKGIEVAFVGRSNSGKSSAINCITGRNALARTSKTPGRTQLINYFQVDDDRRMVDLPGFGFAKVPERVRVQIEEILSSYLSSRICLQGLILLVDIRRSLGETDRQLLAFAIECEKPVHILLTKCDKLKRGAANNALLALRKEVSSFGGKITVQTFSSLKKLGIEQARDLLDDWFSFE